MISNHHPMIAVIGGAVASDEEAQIAYDVGCLLASHNWLVLTGGLGGIMQAAHQGANEAGGYCVAVLPGTDPSEANPYVHVAIAAGCGDARNVILANTARAFIAIGGAFGTLSEIALALNQGKKVVAVKSWALDATRTRGAPYLEVTTAAEAVAAVESERP